jgi:hypothetical protein
MPVNNLQSQQYSLLFQPSLQLSPGGREGDCPFPFRGKVRMGVGLKNGNRFIHPPIPLPASPFKGEEHSASLKIA